MCSSARREGREREDRVIARVSVPGKFNIFCEACFLQLLHKHKINIEVFELWQCRRSDKKSK